MFFDSMSEMFTEKGVFSAMIIFQARQSLTINICFVPNPHNRKMSAKTVVVKSIFSERDKDITTILIVRWFWSIRCIRIIIHQSNFSSSYFFPFRLIKKPWTFFGDGESNKGLYHTTFSYKIISLSAFETLHQY